VSAPTAGPATGIVGCVQAGGAGGGSKGGATPPPVPLGGLAGIGAEAATTVIPPGPVTDGSKVT
jgi:hypothetical protein